MLGIHVLYELHDCDRSILDDPRDLSLVLREAAQAAGCTVIGHRFHQFSPQGVTGVVLLKESHIAVHTWPEHAYAAIDLFTCNLENDLQPVAVVLKERLVAGRLTIRKIQRGEAIEVASGIES